MLGSIKRINGVWYWKNNSRTYGAKNLKVLLRTILQLPEVQNALAKKWSNQNDKS